MPPESVWQVKYYGQVIFRIMITIKPALTRPGMKDEIKSHSLPARSIARETGPDDPPQEV